MPVIEEVNGETAGSGQAGGGQAAGGQNANPTGGSAVSRILNHMTSNKIEAALWGTRLFTIICTFNFFLPILGGNPYSSYQRALLSNAATSALRLHQRLPNFQLTREFFGRLFMEDSAHYLFYSLIFLGNYAVSMTLIPVFLYGLLHATAYTKQLLNIIGPDSVAFIRKLVLKIEENQRSILRFIACNEIFMFPAIIFMIFSGHASLFLPIMYYQFLKLRYSSRRNPYCRQLFFELRVSVDTLTSKPSCPTFVRNICHKSIEMISRFAPPVVTTQ